MEVSSKKEIKMTMKTNDFILTYLQNQMSLIQNQWSNIDTKASFFITLSGLFTTIFIIGNNSILVEYGYGIILPIIPSLIFGILVLYLRPIYFGPDIKVNQDFKLEELTNENTNYLLNYLIKNMSKDISSNRADLSIKIRLLVWTFISTILYVVYILFLYFLQF